MTRMHLHKLFGLTVLALSLAWMTDREWPVPALDASGPRLHLPEGTEFRGPAPQPGPAERQDTADIAGTRVA